MDVTLKIPPGVVRGASAAETPGRWFDTHLTRWVNGVLRPCEGFERIITDTTPADGFYNLTFMGNKIVAGAEKYLGVKYSTGEIRALHPWVDNLGIQRIGVLCDDRVLVFQENQLIDITPEGGMQGPFEDLLAGGYGDGPYGEGTYGTPRPEKEVIKAIGPAYSIDNWGENLVVMTSYDGRLLMWTPNVPNAKCEPVENAPLSNRCFVVTEQRHVVLFSIGGNFRRWGWCSQEDINDWDFNSITNTAGFYDIEPAAPIIGAKAGENGIVITTARNSIFAAYVGLPYIYNQDGIGEHLSPISAGSMVRYPEGVVWISENRVWRHDGASLAPVECHLLDWFAETRSKLYSRYRMSGHALGKFPEIWWHFPRVDQEENDCYIMWNYVENTWAMGYMSRTCGAPSSFLSYPLMSDGRSIFFHEKGMIYPETELPYAETAAINVEAGTRLSTFQQAMPDHGSAHDNVAYTFYGRIERCRPGDAAEFVKGPLITRSDGYLDVGFKARDHRMRIQLRNNNGKSFTFGEMLAKVTKSTKR